MNEQKETKRERAASLAPGLLLYRTPRRSSRIVRSVPRPNVIILLLQVINSKSHVAQAPHLSSHAEPTRFGADDPRSETNEHADGVAHREFLARAERSHDA